MFRINKSPLILLILVLTGLFSCGKERFSTIKENESSKSQDKVLTQNNITTNFTYIKPEVDFLFLWDNSTSSLFVDNTTLNALANLLANISTQFDYHIMIAPLKGSGSAQAKIATSTPTGLSGSALGMQISLSQIPSTALGFTKVSGNQEAGVTRAVDIINANRSNGVFRQNAYVNVVVISNQDDNSWEVKFPPSVRERNQYVGFKLNDLLCLRGNYTPPTGFNCSGITPLNSQQMRFMSVVAYADPNTQSCGNLSYWKKNHVYKEISSKIYSAPYTNSVVLNDQDARSDLETSSGFTNYDSYDLCSMGSFSSLFSGVNASIQATLIPHKYNYAPVAGAGANIDPNEVQVFKNGVSINRLTPPVNPGDYGFTFDNVVQTVNTRYEPTPGEPYTGYVVKLHGTARAVYPDQIRVTTLSPVEFFGYIPVGAKPYEPSITVRINGTEVPKSSVNGWQLVKDSGGNPRFFGSKNIKIQSNKAICPVTGDPSQYCEETPALNRSGYMIQVFGNAVYSNGVNIEVIYDPAS